MKNKLTSLMAGFALLASHAGAEIVLTDDLSAYGYIDIAYTDMDDENNLEGGTAEFELGFDFSPEGSAWSAIAEMSLFGTGMFAGGEDVDTQFETVVITYAQSDELSFSVGNILSYQGFETYDATGLYQFSPQGWYDDGHVYVYSAAYAFGASADYVAEDYALGLWLGESDDSLSVEFLAAYTGIDGFTAKFIYANDPGYETFNFWASYEVGALTLAGEYTTTDYDDGSDLDAFMVLAFYSFGDFGLTGRVSAGEFDDDEYVKYTVSPSYVFSDNVLGLLEVSYVDDDDDNHTTLAAELIYSF